MHNEELKNVHLLGEIILQKLRIKQGNHIQSHYLSFSNLPDYLKMTRVFNGFKAL